MKDQTDPTRWFKFGRTSQLLDDSYQTRAKLRYYAIAVVAVVLALLIKLGLNQLFSNSAGSSTPFLTFFAAIMFSAWYGGFGPGLLAGLLSLPLSNYFFVAPFNKFGFDTFEDTTNSFIFLGEAVFISLLCDLLRQALGQARQEISSRQRLELQLRQERESFAVTLASIGDGVIATDIQGRVSFINHVAAELTGWSASEAEGRPLEEVFQIINQQSRQPVVSPVSMVLKTGTIVGLANHTTLVARDGREFSIDDSGAPIRVAGGEIIGVVLVFRDVTERKKTEEERNRLFANEQSARQAAEAAHDQLLRLQNATAAFSRALTTPQVARIILEQSVETFGAEAGVIALLNKDLSNPQLEIVETIGYSQEEQEQWQRFSLNNPLPITAAIQSGQPNWFTSLEETLTYFPELSTNLPRGEARANIPLMGEDNKVAGALSIRFSQPHSFDEQEKRFILTLSEQGALALERTRLYEGEQNARREAEANQKRLLFLAEASRELASSLDYHTTLHNVANLAVPLFADWCVIDLVLPDGNLERVAAVHQNPEKQQLLIELEKLYPTDPANPHGYPKVIHSGKADLLDQVSEETLEAVAKDDRQLAMLRELGLQSYLCVPLSIRGQILGALSFATAESGRHYSEADLALAEELGQRAALALDNARLYQNTEQALKEREAALALHREREVQLNLLVEAAGSLVSSLELNNLLPVILDLSTRLIEADAYALWRFNPATKLWSPVASAGLSPVYSQTNLQEYEGSTPFDRIIVAPNVEESPMLANRLESYREEGIRSMLVTPLPILGKNSGSLVFYFHQPHTFDQLEVNIVGALANLVAAAIGSAELYEEQSRLRREAELAQERLAYLSEASTILATSLDYETTLQQVVGLAVPRLADWCAVDLVNEEGQVHQVALAPQDPEKVALTHELRQRYPPRPDASSGLFRVLKTGQSELVPVITDTMIETAAQDETHLELLRSLGLKASILVPLIARGRTIGALTLATTRAGRTYGPADLIMAQELARRAARTLDNVMLYQQAQKAIQARDEFLSVAAHELKTPITTQRGFAQMLLRQLDKNPDPARLRRGLETINEQSQKLTRLITQLLDISRLEAAKLTLERQEVDLAALIEQVSATIQASTTRHTIEVQIADPVQAFIDSLRIEQVLINLLDNAIKYSPQGGRIEVALSKVGEDKAAVSVTDQGLGVAPEHRAQLFDRFYQAHSKNYYGGMGLGLYISREIVQLHGGEIMAEFPEEGGTRFIITLPLTSTHEKEPAPYEGWKNQ